MEKHVDFAHMLRWPFLLGWLTVLALWCGVLYVPIHYTTAWDSYALGLWFPKTHGILKQTWFGYTMLLLFGPIATLSPHRKWYLHLSDRGTLPRRMLVASALAAGALNLSLLEIGLIFHDIYLQGYMVKTQQLVPMEPLHRLAGLMLLSFIWGHIIDYLNSRPNKILFLNYRLLIYILSIGLLIGPIGTNVITWYSKQLIVRRVWDIPGYTAAQMMQITVLLWAMGTSVILLWGIRPFFRYSNSRCLNCGYDLQGSMEHGDGTCPECGQDIEIGD